MSFRKVMAVEMDKEVIGLLQEIFAGNDLKYFNGHIEDYLVILLHHLAGRIKEEDIDGPLHQEIAKAAIRANNDIHYGIKLREPFPSRFDD